MAELELYVPFDVRPRFAFNDVPARAVRAGTTYYFTIGDYLDHGTNLEPTSYSFQLLGTNPYFHFTNAYINVNNDDRFQIEADVLESGDPNSVTVEVEITVGNDDGDEAATTFMLTNYKTVTWSSIPLSARQGNETTNLIIDLYDYVNMSSGLIFSLVGDDNPDWASIDGDNLSLDLPAVTAETDFDIAVRARRDLSNISIHANTTITVRVLNVATDGTAWTITRGREFTYNAAAEFTATQTNWSLANNTPAGITIDSDGLITANVAFIADDIVDTLAVYTDEEILNIALTVNDLFPDDLDAPLTNFYSSRRSHDRSARQLYSGIYQYRGGDATLSSDIIVSSENNGYLDFEALVARLVEINNTGIFYVTELRDQISTFHLSASATTSFAAIHIDNGEVGAVTQRFNGNLMLRSGWALNDIYSQWSSLTVDASFHRQGVQTIGTTWAMLVLQQRHGSATSLFRREYKAGDGNSYNPGVRDAGNNILKYNENTVKPNDINVSFAADPFVLNAYSIQTTAGGAVNKALGAWNLTEDENLENFATSSGTSGGTGIELELGDWNWAEMAFFQIDIASDAISSWRADQENYINSLIAEFAGNTFQY